MTLDELKAEAKKRGYYLMKIQPYAKLLPCPVCGSKRTQEWIVGKNGYSNYKRECSRCDFSAIEGVTKLEAREKWNEAVLEYKEKHND